MKQSSIFIYITHHIHHKHFKRNTLSGVAIEPCLGYIEDLWHCFHLVFAQQSGINLSSNHESQRKMLKKRLFRKASFSANGGKKQNKQIIEIK